ncbi:MAG: ISL3 family transposase [Lachnospiraceae bacterium]|nr:ISL3 family transposase [Lachnospiraceae bacterium]
MDISTAFLLGYVIESVEETLKKGRPITTFKLQPVVVPPVLCPECGSKLHGHGSKTVTVVDTPFGGKPAELKVPYIRKRCSNPHCRYMWTSDLVNIDDNHLMTQRAFADMTQKAIKQAFKDVGEEYAIAKGTVRNTFIDFMQDKRDSLQFVTPSFMGIDEIKIKSLGEITVITDLEHRTLYDMIHGRNQELLIKYFDNIPDPENIRWVCSDMYRPFEKPIHIDLPRAKWVVDHYHVVAYANRAMDTVRIRIQGKLSKNKRIKTKKGLAYTLRTRLRNLSDEEKLKIRECRKNPVTEPIAVAFDLKEEFFNIYDENKGSKADAQEAFKTWKTKVDAIPEEQTEFEGFKKLVSTVENFYTQIFNLWDCPIHITNGFTECTNRIIRENAVKGRGTSFDILRGRTLYRRTNLARIDESGMLIGPNIPQKGSIFHFEETQDICDDFDEDESLYFNSYEYDPHIGLRPGVDYDPETGEILESYDDRLEDEEW